MPSRSSHPGSSGDEIEYSFEDRADAILYLQEVARLWVVWIVGLAGLLITNPLAILAWGAVTVTALIILVRPMRMRAERLVQEDKPVSGARGFARGRSLRDVAFSDLSYGSEPMRVALRTAGMSEWWLMTRYLLIAYTVGMLMFSIVTVPLLPSG